MACLLPFAVVCLLAALPANCHVVGKEVSGSTWEHGHLRADSHQPTRVQASSKTDNDDSPMGWLFLGLLLWCLVPVALWNNERIAIKQYKMQFKAERWAIHIDDTDREPLKEMDGRIVYLAGTSKCEEALIDSRFPLVKSEDKIKLRRNVQMFQWVEKSREEEDRDGNKRKVYYWEQEWSDEPESCRHDDEGSHQNPEFPMPSTRRQAPYRAYYDCLAGNGEDCAEAPHEKVRIGAYYLGELVIRELLQWKIKDDVNAEMLQNGGDSLNGEPELQDGWWYFGGASETLGRVRVQFEELHTGPTSIVGVLAQTQQGWTFAPIKRTDEAGIGDNCAAEICGSCCIGVKELHYGDEEDDEALKRSLETRAAELTQREKSAFRKSQTAANIEEYQVEEDISDLCCVGPCGGLVIKLMHWLGLEEEFLAVREADWSLEKIMRTESSEAANRHHTARIVGFILLVLGSLAIIHPIVSILNYNWITTLLGGGLISLVLCIGACLCSTSCFFLIVSTAWIAHRPFLATFGIITAVSIGAGIYFYVYQEEKKAGASPGVQAVFMFAQHAAARLLAHF